MVNFSTAFALPSKNNLYAKKEMNLTCPQLDLYKMETCETSNEPFPVYQQEPPQSGVNEIESSFEIQTKPSPSYMDDDTQFNFPDYQLQNGSKFSSHVMAENNRQPLPVSNILRGTYPKLERQYSINTIMEVIESHDINDITSSNFTSSNPPQQLSNFTQTQPINIQRHTPSLKCEERFSNPCFSRTSDHQQVTVLVPPASDMGDCIQGSSFSCSPGGVPSSCYQEDFMHVPSNTTNTQQAFPLTKQHQSNYMKDSTVVPMHPTEDQLSPYQPVFSPSYSCDTGSSPLTTNINNGQSTQNSIFTFDNFPAQFTPSQSSTAYDYSAQPQFVPPLTPPDSANTVTYVPLHQVPSSYESSLTAGSSSSNFNNDNANQFQLEEIDQSTVRDDLRDLSCTPTTEQEKVDLKRLRNNKACRASRERRKRRKAEKEALADKLLDTNRQLKERVRQLEEEVSSVHEDVRRIMSQKYPDGQVPPCFDHF